MSVTLIGALTGAALAVVGLAFGFWAMVLVAVAAGIGGLIGAAITGRVDVRALIGAFSGRRTSA
ncbi:MAG: DUF2273 domain-containing protein [Galactobacter sp.]